MRDATRCRGCARASEPRDKGKPLPEAVPFPPFLPLIITSCARTRTARRGPEAHFQAHLQNEPRRSTTNRLILMKPPRQRARKSRGDKRAPYYSHNTNAVRCRARSAVCARASRSLEAIDIGDAGCARERRVGYPGRTGRIVSSIGTLLTVTTSCCPRSDG